MNAPAYQRHKGTGQAFVKLRTGPRKWRFIYLGAHGSDASFERYRRVKAELAAGVSPSMSHAGSVRDVFDAWLIQAAKLYRGNELAEHKALAAAVNDIYGSLPAAAFGPKALKVIREGFVLKKWTRKTINARIDRIRTAFRWAVAEELLPAAVAEALAAVDPLKRRPDVAEGRDVKPAPDRHVDAARPHMPEAVRALTQFQELTGCRPSEACTIRRADIDTGGRVWLYRPEHHKNEWRGHERVVAIGPRAQAVLKPLFRPAADAYLFTTARGTPYTRKTYHQAVKRACIAAGVPHWHPNQLRHNHGTRVRKQFGLEAAQVALGHRHADVTQTYAERDTELAEKVAAAIG